jgi:hypothetical protein
MHYFYVLEFSLDLCDRVEKTSMHFKNKYERFLIEFYLKTLLSFLTILTGFRLQSGQLSIIKKVQLIDFLMMEIKRTSQGPI